MIAGWLATLWMIGIVKNTRIKEDGALGLVLSVFFGFGLMLLTFTQRLPDSRQAGLDHFLFGQAAALLGGDVIAMALSGRLGATALGHFLEGVQAAQLSTASLAPAWASQWACWISC